MQAEHSAWPARADTNRAEWYLALTPSSNITRTYLIYAIAIVETTLENYCNGKVSSKR